MVAAPALSGEYEAYNENGKGDTEEDNHLFMRLEIPYLRELQNNTPFHI